MGNKFCKKRVDQTDSASGSKTPKTFHKIINKLNLRPKWKSDSNLDDKQINSDPISTIEVENYSKPLSRSTDWTDCALEAPSSPEPRKESAESKKSIFNDNTTPTPPPRQMKLVRRSLLDTVKDAFKTSTPNYHNNNEEEIEEQIMVKKTINYNCPCGGDHTRAQHEKHTNVKERAFTPNANQKRSKSILVTSSNNSLPNYSDFRLSLPIRPSDTDSHHSALSLPDESAKKNGPRRSITTDLDAYLSRAKSIGSLIPSVLQRLSTNKAPLAEIESDDSLNSINSTENMDNWNGLNMLEHYEPRESSLPRPSRKTEAEMVADLENMMVTEEEAVRVEEEAKIQKPTPPKPPARKSETMLKKMHKDIKSSNRTPPSTPEEQNKRMSQTIEQSLRDNDSDHSPLMKILNNFGADQLEAKMNRSNLSPVHTYIGSGGGGGEKKQKINEFLAAERENDDLYKERIAA